MALAPCRRAQLDAWFDPRVQDVNDQVDHQYQGRVEEGVDGEVGPDRAQRQRTQLPRGIGEAPRGCLNAPAHLELPGIANATPLAPGRQQWPASRILAAIPRKSLVVRTDVLGSTLASRRAPRRDLRTLRSGRGSASPRLATTPDGWRRASGAQRH